MHTVRLAQEYLADDRFRFHQIELHQSTAEKMEGFLHILSSLKTHDAMATWNYRYSIATLYDVAVKLTHSLGLCLWTIPLSSFPLGHQHQDKWKGEY